MLPNSKMQIQNETKMFYTIRIVLISSYTVTNRRPKFLVKFNTNLMENVSYFIAFKEEKRTLFSCVSDPRLDF